jgi:hypothetical protein
MNKINRKFFQMKPIRLPITKRNSGNLESNQKSGSKVKPERGRAKRATVEYLRFRTFLSQ